MTNVILESLPQNMRFWAETFQRNIQVEGISVAFLLGDICGVGLAHYTSNDITSTFSTTLDSQKHQAFQRELRSLTYSTRAVPSTVLRDR